MKISALYIYPIKSCAGVMVSQATITDSGFLQDRCYLLIDKSGKFMTQRQYPKMALLRPFFDAKLQLQLDIPAQGIHTLAREIFPETSLNTRVWADEVLVSACFPSLSAKISIFLNEDCQLVQASTDYIRQIRDYPHATQTLSFADSFPYMLISEESLADLNQRLPEAIKMDRFRPNIVISGSTPYSEDMWQELKIGSHTFYGGKRCSRCKLPEVNPQTGEVDGKIITQTLRDYRSDERGAWYLGRHFYYLASDNIAPDLTEQTLHIGMI